MPPREWSLRVDDILDAIARIERYVEGLTFDQFKTDQKTVDAVVRNLEIIGEAVRHLSAEHDSLSGDIRWMDAAGMRNILIHEYFGVDISIVWQTVVDDLPALRLAVRRLVS